MGLTDRIYFTGEETGGSGNALRITGNPALPCPEARVERLRVRPGTTDLHGNGGCAPDLLWGMYGYKHLAGVMVPPTVALNNPAFFTPGTGGLTALSCPDGSVLNLPAAVQGFPPTFTGHVAAATLRGGTAPAAFRACYGAPKRFRAYRAFLEVMSCGSVHQSMAVQTGPVRDHAPAAITAIGQRVAFAQGAVSLPGVTHCCSFSQAPRGAEPPGAGFLP